MKRGLFLSLCVLALAANANAQAPVVDISLNLRYTDPRDPSQGGKWFLAAKTTAANGIAGLSAYISGIDTAGPGAPVFGTAAIGTGVAAYEAVTGATLGANVSTVGGTPYNTTIGGAVNVVFGMDNSPTGAIVAGVGTSTFIGRQDIDPLQNGSWANSTILMSGGFGATRPAFVANVGPQNNNTDANILGGAPTLGANAVDANVTLTVRGDSLASLGLEGGGEGLALGDANRDFSVGSADSTIVFNNFFTAQGWDGGDVGATIDGTVGSNDITSVFNNFFSNQIPPTAVGVPEPASLALAAFGALGALLVARRRK